MQLCFSSGSSELNQCIQEAAEGKFKDGIAEETECFPSGNSMLVHQLITVDFSLSLGRHAKK